VPVRRFLSRTERRKPDAMTPLLSLIQSGEMHEHMAHAMDEMRDTASLPDHHMAGVFLLLLGLLAFLESTPFAEHRRWARLLWPLPLIALGLFLLFGRDNLYVWPAQLLHFQIGETVVQHKLFESAAVLIGCIELARRLGRLKHPAWPHLLSLLMLAGGIALLFHGGAHSPIVHLEHRWMAIVIMALAIMKMAADRRAANGFKRTWMACYAVPLLFIVLGLQFALYVE
jgi:hypothetical protein